jgi:hypothetical protein
LVWFGLVWFGLVWFNDFEQIHHFKDFVRVQDKLLQRASKAPQPQSQPQPPSPSPSPSQSQLQSVANRVKAAQLEAALHGTKEPTIGGVGVVGVINEDLMKSTLRSVLLCFVLF